MPYSAKIEELSKQLEDCKDDTEALRLVQELQTLIHEQISQVRKKLAAKYPRSTRGEEK